MPTIRLHSLGLFVQVLEKYLWSLTSQHIGSLGISYWPHNLFVGVMGHIHGCRWAQGSEEGMHARQAPPEHGSYGYAEQLSHELVEDKRRP